MCEAMPPLLGPQNLQQGLPSTYIDVGTLDITRDGDLSYAAHLLQANVPSEFHL